MVNYILIHGSFDLELTTDKILYRLTTFFNEGKIVESIFDYLVHITYEKVELYNDKIAALAQGNMTLDELSKGFMKFPRIKKGKIMEK